MRLNRLSQAGWFPSLLNPSHASRFLWPGLVVTLLTCVVGVIAIHTSAGLLYLLLGLLLGLWVVSAVFSSFNLAGLSVRREVSGTSQVGEKLVIRYTLTNHKRFFHSYSLVLEEPGSEWEPARPGYAISLAAGQKQQVTVEISTRHRGHLRLNKIRISSRFPFSLAAKCLLVNQPCEIVIHPSLGRIRHDFFARQQIEGSGGLGPYNQRTKGFEEYMGLREFQNFDNIRWIHWRSSAKQNRLMVKEMSETHANRITILLDCRLADPNSSAQRSRLELAISFAAALIDRACERSVSVGLVVSGGEAKVIQHGQGSGHRWRLMTELAGLHCSDLKSELPSPPEIRPRSWVDSQYWLIGAGVSRQPDVFGVKHYNVTVVDSENTQFDDWFTPDFVETAAGSAE